MNKIKCMLYGLIVMSALPCDFNVTIIPAQASTIQPSNQHDLRYDPLPSWNNSNSKQAILEFIQKVTDPKSSDFVPEKDRIAVFDNDGTLWGEQPSYYQTYFMLDRLKTLSPRHPEWKTQEPYKSILENKLTIPDLTEHELMELIMITHAGMTVEEFHTIVKDWIETAEHPILKQPYLNLIYQPMLELLTFLKEKNFKIYIVSGGGVDFLRPWTEKTYGLPPEQIIGSSIATKYVLNTNNNAPQLIRQNKIDFINDKQGKPIAIEKFIGKRPILAFGNSDGDLQMLEWTTKNSLSPKLGVIIHHTDDVREFAYDKKSKIGHLEQALDQAPKNKWIVVDMKNDWNQIYKKPNKQNNLKKQAIFS